MWNHNCLNIAMCMKSVHEVHILFKQMAVNTIGQYTFCRTIPTEKYFVECLRGPKTATWNILETVEMHY